MNNVVTVTYEDGGGGGAFRAAFDPIRARVRDDFVKELRTS
jgi:hypothetical protein